MSFESAFASYEHAIKEKVLVNTWGHLAPKHRQILFEQMNEFIGRKNLLKDNETFAIFIFKGKYQLYNNGNYRFSGKINKVKIKL